MIRTALVVALATSCGRSDGVPDRELGGLVIAPKREDTAIDVARAVKDPAELGRALAQGDRAIAAAIGPHELAIATTTTVDEGAARVSALDERATIEVGEAGAFHGVYTNSEDYGREVTFVAGKLYLRPRYQRWHGRAPEAADEPGKLRDGFAEAVGATWELVAPGVELDDRGVVQVAGRSARKIEFKLAPTPRPIPAEPLAQRQWRAHRTIDAVAGTVLLDADKRVPLAVELVGTIGFSRDGRRFAMKVSVKSELSAIGKAATIVAPPEGDVVATPERLREVDDRDFLLHGIAPPLRKSPTGTASPAPGPAPSGAATPTKAKSKQKPDKPDRRDKPDRSDKPDKRAKPDQPARRASPAAPGAEDASR